MKKEELLKELEWLYEKRSELEKKSDRLLNQSFAADRKFTNEESCEYNHLNFERMKVRERINEISETLKMYAVVEDCLEGFYERLKAELSKL